MLQVAKRREGKNLMDCEFQKKKTVKWTFTECIKKKNSCVGQSNLLLIIFV